MSKFQEFDVPRARKPRQRKLNRLFRRRPTPLADLEREPLDLEPDTPAMRALKAAEATRRRWRWAFGLVVAGLVVFLGYKAIDVTVLRNPRFALQNIKVETEGMLTKQQIRLAAEIPEGTNLLLVNMADVQAKLMKMPAVADAKATRDYEGHLHLVVTQRQPIAWIQCEQRRLIPKTSGRGMLTDAEGHAIPAELVLKEFESLPVIADETLDEVRPGEIIEGHRFQGALALLKAIKTREQAGKTSAPLSITMPNSFAYEVSFADGANVTFGFDDLPGQLERFDRVLAAAKARTWTVEKLNVIAHVIVPASFRDKEGRAVKFAEPALANDSASRQSSDSASSQRRTSQN